MSDDWSTVNVRRDQVRRELDAVRQHYLDHRAAVQRLAAEAPSEHLAGRYGELLQEIETAIAKLEELAAGRVTATPRTAPGRTPLPGVMDAPGTPQSVTGSPWDTIAPDPALDENSVAEIAPPPGSGSRALLILFVGALLLALLALFGWKWTHREPATAVPGTTEQIIESGEQVEGLPDGETAALSAELSLSPASVDVGTIAKGTRAVRQFEIMNSTSAPVTVQVARSACRCLWFEYSDIVPAKGSTSLSVTIDASKAPAGRLTEVVQVSAGDVTASAELRADIR